MTNRELNERLKSAPVPERSAKYWAEFPKKVTAKIHWQSQSSTTLSRNPLGHKPNILSWSFGFAVLLVVIGSIAGFWPHAHSRIGSQQLTEARKYYQEFEGLFPNQLQAIVFDRTGPRMVLADQANLPGTAPLYLKVCGPKGCESFVTFSGQQIRVNGEDCEVLANGQGGVMLVGSHNVWSQDVASRSVHIEAKYL